MDIEGSTRVGNRIFWIGSQSHAAIGAVRQNRSRVFATDIAGQGLSTTLTYAGRYDFIKTENLYNFDGERGFSLDQGQ